MSRNEAGMSTAALRDGSTYAGQLSDMAAAALVLVTADKLNWISKQDLLKIISYAIQQATVRKYEYDIELAQREAVGR